MFNNKLNKRPQGKNRSATLKVQKKEAFRELSAEDLSFVVGGGEDGQINVGSGPGCITSLPAPANALAGSR